MVRMRREKKRDVREKEKEEGGGAELAQVSVTRTSSEFCLNLWR